MPGATPHPRAGGSCSLTTTSHAPVSVLVFPVLRSVLCFCFCVHVFGSQYPYPYPYPGQVQGQGQGQGHGQGQGYPNLNPNPSQVDGSVQPIQQSPQYAGLPTQYGQGQGNPYDSMGPAQARYPPQQPQQQQFGMQQRYQQPQQVQQPQEGSFWSRVSSKLFQGSGSDPQQQGVASRHPKYTSGAMPLPSQGFQQRPGGVVPVGPGRMPPPSPQSWSQPPARPQQNGEGSFWSRIKNQILGGNEEQQPPRQPSGYPRSFQPPVGPPGYSEYGGIPSSPQQGQVMQHQQPPQQPNALYPPLPPLPSSAPPGYGQQPQQQHQLPAERYGIPPHVSQQPYEQMPPVPPPFIPEGPGTPEAFVIDDSIVIVLKPHTLQNKKYNFIRAGSESIQVFADFEGTFTRFKNDMGTQVPTTEQLLFEGGMLLPQAAAKLRQMKEDMSARGFVDDTALEDFKARLHQVIALEGGLHMGALGPLIREALQSVALRDGWIDMLRILQSKNVPIYVFSEGYGDLCAQILLQSGMQEGLPQNLRIVSNFFRSTPDGSVRGFSSPIIHSSNKNATSAMKSMEMLLSDRPNCIVVSHSEDGLTMTDGANINEVISIGFLELTEDVTHKLPKFLETFDAVVIGDGSMRQVQHVLSEVLGV